MQTFISLSLFVIGFFILAKSANALVRGAVSLAKNLRISEWLVGVVIVGFGTSVPEFAVALTSALEGTGVGLGTLVGSNVFNTLVILGLLAFVTPVVFKKVWVKRDIPINILAVVAVLLCVFFPIAGNHAYTGITHQEALILFILFICWLIYVYVARMPFEEDGELRTDSGLVSFALIAVGLVGTFLGGIWVVGGAKTIADILGVSGTHIGLTLIPLGTSLPELTVSYAALKKNRPSIAISNVIGSNIFNVLGILSVVGFITPMPADSNSLIQVLIAGIALLALPVVLLIRSKRLLWERYRLARLGGALLLASYMIYQIILFNL